MNSADGFVCLCPSEFMGDGRLSGSSCFLDECSTIADCVEIAACVNSADGFVCLCPSEFMGDGRLSGSSCFLDECSTIADCVENATCVNSPDGFVCLCPPDLTGDGRTSGTGCNGWYKCSSKNLLSLLLTINSLRIVSIVQCGFILLA